MSGSTQTRAADLLTIGFGTTTLMWAVGYFCRLFGEAVPAPLLFALLLLSLAAGGVVAGLYTRRGPRGGLAAGAITGLLNLLIVGSLISGDTPNSIRAGALLWIPGTVIVCTMVLGLGATVGTVLRAALRKDAVLDAASAETRESSSGSGSRSLTVAVRSVEPDWPGAFATVAVLATFLLLTAGGLVTGFDEGLAVVDWPNSQGYNMFLYPLSRMTGGVYLEHSHRLLGSLVGLTVLVLAVHTHFSEHRRSVRWWAWLALAAVVVQGVLGGLRVTGRLTLTTSAAETSPSILLAIIHGVLGQLVFGALVALAVLRSRAWQHAASARVLAPTADADRSLAAALILVVIVQLVLGALTRHFTWAVAMLPHGLTADPAQLIALGQRMLLVHVTFAALVVLIAVAAGVRAWGLYSHVPRLSQLGRTLLILTGLQVLLGVAALIASGGDAVDRRPGGWDVAITTLHQIVGAALLATAVLLLLWNRRLLAARALAGSVQRHSAAAGSSSSAVWPARPGEPDSV